MSEGEVKTIDMMEKMTSAQQEAAKKAYHRQEATKLAAYKKGLREGNDLKKLQVEELELNVRYFNAKKLWMAAQPELMEIEAQEQAIAQKQRAEQQALIKEQEEIALKKAADEVPEIVIPKIGKANPCAM